MKRIVFLLLLVVSVTAFAGSPIKLISGSVNGMNKKNVTIIMQFDYSNCKIFDEDTEITFEPDDFYAMKGDDWVRDKGKDIPEAERSFSETFNEESDNIVAVYKPELATYTIVYKMDLFCYGNPVATMVAGPFTPQNAKGFACGTFDIIDNSTNEVVATLSSDRIFGSIFAATWSIKREYVYDNVAEELAEFFNKQRK